MNKLKRSNKEKGITLIALIITVVVLLILAAVAISSIQNDNIISHANNAVTQYDESQKNEQTTLDGYMETLYEYTGYPIVDKDGNDLRGQQVSTTTEVWDKNENKIVIPAGFKIRVDGTTNYADTVEKGIVIEDENANQFVWIPVNEIDSFARLQDGSETNYRGVLYDWKTDSTGKTEYTWSEDSTSNRREPANLSSTYYDNTTNLSTWTENLYQETFDAMVESVSKYKGFYVGRYETSLNDSGIAQSKAGVASMYGITWFEMYENSKEYSTSNTNLDVVSEMIWGCQYDAMMKWMQSNNIDVTSLTPIDIIRGVVASYNKSRITGGADNNDILNNVYDLIGNSREWTQEAKEPGRVYRGDSYDIGENLDSPSFRSSNVPTHTTNDLHGSRLSLYIKVSS